MDFYESICNRLILSCGSGNENQVRKFLEDDVDYSFKNYKCFREAIKRKRNRCLELLFLYSRIIPKTNMIVSAIKYDNIHALEYMISLGADINAFVSEESNILDFADKNGASSEIILILKTAGAFPSNIL
jgi:hypothetical protein